MQNFNFIFSHGVCVWMDFDTGEFHPIACDTDEYQIKWNDENDGVEEVRRTTNYRRWHSVVCVPHNADTRRMRSFVIRQAVASNERNESTEEDVNQRWEYFNHKIEF